MQLKVRVVVDQPKGAVSIAILRLALDPGSLHSVFLGSLRLLQRQMTPFPVFILFGLANGEMQERISRKLIDFPTIYVDPSNLGSFPTIQSAINSVPSNNNQWICISVKAGVYNERVTIPPEKPFLYLKGEGMGKTNVVWSSNDSIVTSATFSSLADNIVVSDMTFVNSYNYPFKKDGNKISAAVAAMISGDKSAFYQCSFLGLQDTLFDEKGRHYFKLCTINGAIDFIFGGGQSIYEECTLSFNGETLNPGTEGFITAQGRDDPKDRGGFVFNKCNVTGMGKTFLGRAWKSYSRVIFYNSFLSDIVIPQGWDAWNALGHENQLTFAEHQCYGSGSDVSNRVNWETTLSSQELQTFTSTSYIDNEGWIANLPLNMLG
ncbi:putative pectinesterase 29 [Forsythia ovata]|uniref:Pectinesterase n=1 Tax=Forsythia ovata TaxID=205694 RepID=A0ABD1PHG1_9LAMI